MYIINRDYSSFISLSTSLVGLDQVIASLRVPLAEMEGTAVELLKDIDAYMRELKEKLKEKAEVAEKRQILELFVETHRSVEKIELLLNIDNNHLEPTGLKKVEKEERIAGILMKSDENTCKLIQVMFA